MQQQYSSDKSLISTALCSSYGSAYCDITSVPPVTNYTVKQMPLFWSRVHPSCLIFISMLESVGYYQVIFCTKAQQDETNGKPVLEVITNSGIIVRMQEKLVNSRSWFDKTVKVLLEVLFYLSTAGHGKGISANDCNMPRRVEGKVELNQPFIGAPSKIWKLMQKCCSGVKSYPVNSALILCFSFPEKCVSSFWFTNWSSSPESHIFRVVISLL